MSDTEIKLIDSSVDNFKKLTEEKKMFVLGLMQGIIISQPDKEVADRLMAARQDMDRKEINITSDKSFPVFP